MLLGLAALPGCNPPSTKHPHVSQGPPWAAGWDCTMTAGWECVLRRGLGLMRGLGVLVALEALGTLLVFVCCAS